jgi:hypothetical protein
MPDRRNLIIKSSNCIYIAYIGLRRPIILQQAAAAAACVGVGAVSTDCSILKLGGFFRSYAYNFLEEVLKMSAETNEIF